MTQVPVYDVTVRPMTTMLKNLSGLLEKAAQHAQTKKTDVAAYLESRLISDQYSLLRQIQSACDNAKFCASRLTGKDAPKFPDTEKTYDEIQKRIKDTVAYLDTIKADDFKGYESRKQEFSFLPGKYLEGKDYLADFVIANFYFHYTTAYSILRANGVDLGKPDFLGNVPFKS